MPPAFSAEEKARIKSVLMDNGYRLFTTRGLRKTSLDELITSTGIAKSSFYVFFDSKEALYLELMLAEAADVKHRVVDPTLLSGTDTREQLRGFLTATLTELDTNPLWRRLMSHPEEMEAVSRRLEPGRVAELAENPAVALFDYVDRKRAAGELPDIDSQVIVGVLRCVLLLPMQAERIGDAELFGRVIDLLVDLIVTGLAAPERRE